jgi:hypothetical protein
MRDSNPRGLVLATGPARPGGIRQAVADGGYGTMMALIEGTGELRLVTPD